MKARSFLVTAFVVLTACQTYDFEPVKPLAATQHLQETDLTATPLPPNIMLLLDKSGSMKERIVCTSPPCPTRIAELRDAMKEFLEQSRAFDPDPGNGNSDKKDLRPLGRFGLTLYPTNEECNGPTGFEYPLVTSDNEAALQARIDEIQKYIYEELDETKNPDMIRGGTPTAAALEYLLNNTPEFKQDDLPKEQKRNNYILLLTDGLPNCDTEASREECPQGECICTLFYVTPTPPQKEEEGTCTPLGRTRCPAGRGELNCLVERKTVRVIRQLAEQGVQTVVIGFGAELTGGLAHNVLNEMAKAGSDFRKCSQSSNPNCVAYYPAGNRNDLIKALADISKVLVQDPCEFKLTGTPSSPELLVVYVGNKRIEPGPNTYVYSKDNNTVYFHEDGELCSRLKASTPTNPVNVRFAVLQTL